VGVRVESSKSRGSGGVFFRALVLLLYPLFRLKYNSSYLSILPFETIIFRFYFALEALFLVYTKVSLVLVSINLLNPIELWSFFALSPVFHRRERTSFMISGERFFSTL
jgi:hypothetical protein